MEKIDYLDAEELLHLAIRADGMPDMAIPYLKRGLELAPDDARFHYCLGAQYASIGLMERAIHAMTRAIELDPSLTSARFQLGMLYMNLGQAEQATSTWAALDALGDDDCFSQFKTGLCHLMRDEFDDCERHLRDGITLNRVSEALNRDMQNILGQIAALRSEGRLEPVEATLPVADTGSNHFLLGAYAAGAGT
jgi:tetratricopeptide (TPR) repeat protein